MISENHWLKTRPIAHRGLHNETYPENSLPAFLNAAEQGVPIELDVHISTDGVLFVFHDDNALRMTDLDADVNQMTFAEIKKLKLKKPWKQNSGLGGFSGFDESFDPKEDIYVASEYGIPTFDEVLNAVAGRVPLLIETKSDLGMKGRDNILERKLSERMAAYEKECAAAGRECEYALQSFDPRSIRALKKLNPEYITGQLSQDMSHKEMGSFSKWVFSGCRLCFYGRPDFIAYKGADLPVPRIMAKHRKGMPLLVWTVRSDKEEKRARKYCDNIIYEKYTPAAYRETGEQ